MVLFHTVTSGLQSVSVVHYENETLKIMCIFAEGSKSTGCQVMLTIDSVTTTTIDIDRLTTPLYDIIYCSI